MRMRYTGVYHRLSGADVDSILICLIELSFRVFLHMYVRKMKCKKNPVCLSVEIYDFLTNVLKQGKCKNIMAYESPVQV